MNEVKLQTGIYQLKIADCQVVIEVQYAAGQYEVRLISGEQNSPGHLQALKYAANFARQVIADKQTRNFFDSKYLNS